MATAFGSTRVYFHGRGEATPLVLLPPLGGNGLCWYPLIGHLPTDRTVITPDTIGTPGRSEQTAPVTNVGEFAAWLDELLAALGVGKAHLMGYSEGAWHAAMAMTALGYRRTLPWPRILTDEELASVEIPVLAVLGGRSPVGKPLEARDRILAHISNSRVEIIEGSAHDLLFHRPGVGMPHILDFLRSNEPAAV